MKFLIRTWLSPRRKFREKIPSCAERRMCNELPYGRSRKEKDSPYSLRTVNPTSCRSPTEWRILPISGRTCRFWRAFYRRDQLQNENPKAGKQEKKAGRRKMISGQSRLLPDGDERCFPRVHRLLQYLKVLANWRNFCICQKKSSFSTGFINKRLASN